MDDVSQIVGQVEVKWAGKNYLIGPFGYADWGVLQEQLKKEKRGRMIRTVLDMRDMLSAAEFEEMKGEALKKASNITGLALADYQEIMSSIEGISHLMWILFERSYPGEFTRETVAKMIQSDAITEEDGVLLASQLETALGSGDAGNSHGQDREEKAVE